MPWQHVGAVSTGDEDDGYKGDDLNVAHRALNINLDEYVIIITICSHIICILDGMKLLVQILLATMIKLSLSFDLALATI